MMISSKKKPEHKTDQKARRAGPGLVIDGNGRYYGFANGAANSSIA
jgi:hypothetical protein